MTTENKPWYKKSFSFVRKCIVFVVGLLYFFVYFGSFILSVVSRALLGISYFGMGDFAKFKNVFKFMFNRNTWTN